MFFTDSVKNVYNIEGCEIAQLKSILEELKGMKMADFIYKKQPKERSVCDIIASMTDRYAMNLYSKLFFPSPLV